MVLAVLIYLFLRPDLPDAFGYIPYLQHRHAIGLDRHAFSEFVIFNLPDGLWAYSFGSFIRLSFMNEPHKSAALAGGLIFVISLEPTQLYYGHGVFDAFDMASMTLAYLSAQLVGSCYFFASKR